MSVDKKREKSILRNITIGDGSANITVSETESRQTIVFMGGDGNPVFLNKKQLADFCYQIEYWLDIEDEAPVAEQAQGSTENAVRDGLFQLGNVQTAEGPTLVSIGRGGTVVDDGQQVMVKGLNPPLEDIPF